MLRASGYDRACKEQQVSRSASTCHSWSCQSNGLHLDVEQRVQRFNSFAREVLNNMGCVALFYHAELRRGHLLEHLAHPAHCALAQLLKALTGLNHTCAAACL